MVLSRKGNNRGPWTLVWREGGRSHRPRHSGPVDGFWRSGPLSRHSDKRSSPVAPCKPWQGKPLGKAGVSVTPSPQRIQTPQLWSPGIHAVLRICCVVGDGFLNVDDQPPTFSKGSAGLMAIGPSFCQHDHHHPHRQSHPQEQSIKLCDHQQTIHQQTNRREISENLPTTLSTSRCCHVFLH